MSPAEIGVIVVGVALGYWVVRKSLDAQPRNSKPGQPTNNSFSQSADKPAPQNVLEDRLENTWFHILDVPETASSEQIATAYKQKMSLYHPDKVQTLGPELRELAESKSKEINAAYDFAVKRI